MASSLVPNAPGPAELFALDMLHPCRCRVSVLAPRADDDPAHFDCLFVFCRGRERCAEERRRRDGVGVEALDDVTAELKP